MASVTCCKVLFGASIFALSGGICAAEPSRAEAFLVASSLLAFCRYSPAKLTYRTLPTACGAPPSAWRNGSDERQGVSPGKRAADQPEPDGAELHPTSDPAKKPS